MVQHSRCHEAASAAQEGSRISQRLQFPIKTLLQSKLEGFQAEYITYTPTKQCTGKRHFKLTEAGNGDAEC